MKAITLATRSQVAGTTFSKPKLVAERSMQSAAKPSAD